MDHKITDPLHLQRFFLQRLGRPEEISRRDLRGSRRERRKFSSDDETLTLFATSGIPEAELQIIVKTTQNSPESLPEPRQL